MRKLIIYLEKILRVYVLISINYIMDTKNLKTKSEYKSIEIISILIQHFLGQTNESLLYSI